MKGNLSIEINGYKCDILRYTYEFQRDIHSNGMPKSFVFGGNIYVEMEANDRTDILEVMLSKKLQVKTCCGVEYHEPCPCSGKIRCVDDDESVIRELKFDEAYLSCYGERFDAEGKMPLTAWLSISAIRLDINRNLQLDRRWETTVGVWMEKEREDFVPKKVVSESSPTPLVTSVKGENSALPSQKVKYTVTGYNFPNVAANDRKRVKWIVEVNGKQEVQKECGEVLDLLIKEEWAGEEIIVMPYLKKETKEVSALTVVQKRIVVLFIGGAADKDNFYMIKNTNLIEDGALTHYLNWMESVKSIISDTLYLGYDEVFRDEHVANLCQFIGSTKTPVYIIGHSLGGWNGAHLSHILTDKGYNIEMLITLDPVGKGAMVWATSDIHYELPTPKAKYWINISASPDKNNTSDIIANIGERWIPETGPDINYITKEHHGNVYRMFNEHIHQGQSAFSLLKECITKKQ